MQDSIAAPITASYTPAREAAAAATTDFGIAATRAFACIMVVVVHAAATTFYSFSGNWWPTNVYDSLARPCVPLFFMISGALLLPKQEPLAWFFRKRMTRILAPLLFWSIVYLLFLKLVGRSHTAWLRTIFAGPVAAHLWYLYALVGLYAFVPLLRRMYASATESEKRYYLVLWFLIGVVYPTAARYFRFSWDGIGLYNLGAFTGYAGFLFLGAYLYEHRKALSPAAGYALYAAASLATMLLTWRHSLQRGAPDVLFYEYLTPFVALASIALFHIFLGMRLHPWSLPGRALLLISECSLGIYCIHVMVLDLLYRFGGLSAALGSAWWSLPVTALAALLVSLAASFLMRKTPLLQHLA